MKIKKIFLVIFLMLLTLPAFSTEQTFDEWLVEFKKYALKNNISNNTFDKTMSEVIFLPKVIKSINPN